jgi:ribulose 1,5-bisphosphate synthetase/thiazole synthase
MMVQESLGTRNTDIASRRITIFLPSNIVCRYSADVIVIGSGAGGGTVAAQLVRAGFIVLVLEKGPYMT